MHAMDRVSDLRDSWRERRLRMRNDDLDHENRAMRERMRALQDELEHEREARGKMMQTLENLKPQTVKVKRRRGGVLRLVVVGGTAYVLGAKAGRERYEELRGWWQRVRSRGTEAIDEGMEEMTEGTPRRDDGTMPLSA